MASEYVFAHAIVCVMLLCVAPRAQAAPSAAERDTARSLMDEGDRMLNSGRLSEAMERYRAAHAIMHVPTTGLELARIQAQLGWLVEARATAMEVLNLPRAEDEPAVFEHARAQAVVLVRELEPRVPALRTQVMPTNRSYQLSVDGVKLPDEAREVPFRTNPGPHRVRVEAEGYAIEQREVSLVEGEVLTIELRLSPLPAAELAIEPRAPAAALRTDDVLDARAAGRTRGMVGLGFGIAGIVVGSVTGAVALVQTRQELHNCHGNLCDASRADALRTANTYANIANVSFAVAVLGVAYGTYELLTLPAQAHANIALGPTGIQLRGAL